MARGIENTRPYHDNVLEMYNDVFIPNLQAAWTGDKSAEQAIDDMASRANEL